MGLLSPDVLALALVIGSLYGLLAIGFVLIYKASRVLNMAHGNLGGMASILLAVTVRNLGWGYWPSLLVAIASGVAVGLLVEVFVIDKLRDAPRLVVLVATIALAQLLVVGTSLIISPSGLGRLLLRGYPQPFDLTVTIGSSTLRGADLFTLMLVPVVAIVLAVFFRFTRYGLAIRATAENVDNARLVGISVRRVSLVVWAIGGALAAIAAVLYSGSSGSAIGVGPSLLLRSLAPAVLARLTSLPGALAWGIVIGYVEQAVLYQTGNAGLVDLLLLVVILLMLLAQRATFGRVGALDRSSWPAAHLRQVVPVDLRSVGITRRLRRAVAVAAVAFAVVLPFSVSGGQIFAVITVIPFAMTALSLTVLTGYAGQLSLGQWAVTGVGAFAAARASAEWGWQFWAALLVAVAAGGLVAVVIGLPALRIRGLLLAVATLAFAVASSGYLFRSSWFAGGRGGFHVSRPDFASSDRRYYFCALLGLVVAIALVRATGRGRLGRNIVAVRENEATAASLGVNVVATKLLTFGLSGCLAGLAGGILAFAQQTLSGDSFGVEQSFQVVIVTIVGGVASIAGALVGTTALVAVPTLVPDQAIVATLAGGGTLLVILQKLPGGLISLAEMLRRALLTPAIERSPADTEQLPGRLPAPVGPVGTGMTP